MHPEPISRGPWKTASRVHADSGEEVGSRLILRRLTRQAIYEIWSIRFAMSSPGTSLLAAMAISDGIVPAGVGNDDAALLQMARENTDAQPRPNTFWTFGRSQQFVRDHTEHMPPDFFWQGEMHGVFQNGAGATVTFLWIVLYRIVTFSEVDFPHIVNQIMPAGSTKHST